jgi:2-polyprenyl-3-methyl-5-hydroxy-6-metoxy-1,4-benzoquinol methylase
MAKSLQGNLCLSPLVSILISAHYPERWIADTINSVLAPEVAYFAKD